MKSANMPRKNNLIKLGFQLKNDVSGIFLKRYPSAKNYLIEVNLDAETVDYGTAIVSGSQSTISLKTPESWVVLECVDRLLIHGYQPKNIVLEKTWPTGHGTSGRLDILVLHDDGSSYMMIECKTYGAEFEKAYKKLLSNGGQLFTYFQQDKQADVLMLYASEFNSKSNVIYRNEIVNVEDDYRETSNVKDFYDRWNKLTKKNGVFDDWVKPYNFQSKAITPRDLKDITQADSGFIFNRFL
jgi:type I restriction enzyme M protein